MISTILTTFSSTTSADSIDTKRTPTGVQIEMDILRKYSLWFMFILPEIRPSKPACRLPG